MKKLATLICLTALVYGCSDNQQPDTQKASLVLIGGNVITVDQNFSTQSAVAVNGDQILAVGSDDEIRKHIGENTEVIELNGRTALPGIIDVHGHVHSYGRLLQNLDLNGTTSYQQIIDMVAERAQNAEPGDWIIGQGWDQNNWPGKQFPIHHELSKVSPNNPVILNRTDGHAILVNQEAMNVAGINTFTPDPHGGKIIRGDDGEATGVFVDLAEELVRQYEPVTDRLIKERTQLTLNELLKVGVTNVHDLGVSPQELNVYKDMANKDELAIRIYAMFDDPMEEIDFVEFFEKNKVAESKDNMLVALGIKMYRDGALGSRGALLAEPYSDDPHNYGIEVASQEHIYQVSRAALQTGIQVTTHAIGDAAVTTTLDAYEKAFHEFPDTIHRFRMEHAQIINRLDIPRLVNLGVIPSVQPGSVISDMDWTEIRIGSERVLNAYLFRDFINAGMPIIFSSDFPTESINPFQTMYRAITRKDEEGNPEAGWYPEQKVTIEEAIKAQTIWAAQSGYQEQSIGSIEVGKLADIIIIDNNPLTATAEEVLNTKVMYSIVNGKVKYQLQ